MRMPFGPKRLALLCSIAIATPAVTFAANTLVVTAKPEETSTTPTEGYTATVSKGATKTDRPLITTGQSVSVVTRQQMDDQGAMDVNQALNYTAGAFTNFAGAATRYDTVSLRGFHGGDVDNIFLDGLRLMSDPGSYNVLQVDPWFLERIDVIKGPSSALYGQTVPGGLVMETSKRPQYAPAGHFRLSTGTHNTNSAAFDYTNAINDQWAFRLTGITRNSDTQYDHTREEKYAISPSLLWQPDEDTSLLLRAYLQKILPVATTAPCRVTAASPSITDVSSAPVFMTATARWISSNVVSKFTARSSLTALTKPGPSAPMPATPIPMWIWIRFIRLAGIPLSLNCSTATTPVHVPHCRRTRSIINWKPILTQARWIIRWCWARNIISTPTICAMPVV